MTSMTVARAMLDVFFAGLWQGAIVLAVAGSIMALAGPRLNATTRTLAYQMVFAAIVLVPAISTIPGLMRERTMEDGYGVAGASQASRAAFEKASEAASRRIDIVLGDGSVAALISLWFAGFTLFSLRVALGTLQPARILRAGVRLEDRDGVALYGSPIASVPFTVGIRKPAIVVPLPLAQRGGPDFENVLLHELAHVRRRDVCSSICELGVHALLFFNPAAVIVLRAIAFERETACDDWAVARSRDLASYAQSLAAFAVWGAAAGPATASGFGNATLARIERLENARRNGAISLSHYFFGGFLTMLAIAALTFSTLAPAFAFAAPPAPSQHIVADEPCEHNARILSATAPDYSGGGNLDSLILVVLASNGKIVDAKVSKTSGNATFDSAVLTAAKKSIYAPASVGCKRVAGTYVFRARTGP